MGSFLTANLREFARMLKGGRSWLMGFLTTEYADDTEGLRVGLIGFLTAKYAKYAKGWGGGDGVVLVEGVVGWYERRTFGACGLGSGV